MTFICKRDGSIYIIGLWLFFLIFYDFVNISIYSPAKKENLKFWGE